MRYIIYKDGVEVNRILADEEFCEQYYSTDGYSYEKEPDPPYIEPIDPEPPKTDIDLLAEAYREGVNNS